MEEKRRKQSDLILLKVIRPTDMAVLAPGR